ncbi:hypothetical protein RRG08_045053 [Elysia crispata]|uniref:Uncharacterized protein n=1 Tax=Elysia crispata TaxID=231223 RepID=A0AAE0XU36_9GAST|nr:hypothetical protein RRG08_045053 [Elysia crispata]
MFTWRCLNLRPVQSIIRTSVVAVVPCCLTSPKLFADDTRGYSKARWHPRSRADPRDVPSGSMTPLPIRLTQEA